MQEDEIAFRKAQARVDEQQTLSLRASEERATDEGGSMDVRQEETKVLALSEGPFLAVPSVAILRDELQSMVLHDLLGPAGGPEEELDVERVHERYWSVCWPLINCRPCQRSRMSLALPTKRVWKTLHLTMEHPKYRAWSFRRWA